MHNASPWIASSSVPFACMVLWPLRIWPVLAICHGCVPLFESLWILLLVYSVTLSGHILHGLPLLLPKVETCSVVAEVLLALMMYPYYVNLLFLTVDRKSFNGPVSCLMVSCIASFAVYRWWWGRGFGLGWFCNITFLMLEVLTVLYPDNSGNACL